MCQRKISQWTKTTATNDDDKSAGFHHQSVEKSAEGRRRAA